MVLLGLDLFAALLAFLLSYLVSSHYFLVGDQISKYAPIFLIFVFFLTVSLYLLNAYKPIEDRRSETELEITVKGITIAFLLLLAMRFIFFKKEMLSRYIILLWWSSLLFIMPFFRFGLREIYKNLWRKGYLRQKVLLVGNDEGIRSIEGHLAIQRHYRFEYVGPLSGAQFQKNEIQKVIDQYNVDRVFVIPGRFPYEKVSEISNYCRLKGIIVNIVSDEFSMLNQRISVDEFTGLLTFEAYNSAPFTRGLNKIVKRAMDIISVFMGLPIVGFFYVVIGIAAKMEDGGPVIFRRRVMGKSNEEFDAFKFRSMLVDADEILERNPELKKEFEKNYKLESDPRLTRIGAYIRKYSLDELPQIVNVLLGQMSLVGPRMKVKEEVEKHYGEFRDKLLTVKPGITGFWQTNGRQETSYDERVRMDMFYIDHWSIWMDIIIIIKTIWKVLKREGAC